MKEKQIQNIFDDTLKDFPFFLNPTEQSDFWSLFGKKIYDKYCEKPKKREIVSECCGEPIQLRKDKKSLVMICAGCNLLAKPLDRITK
jgi:hypothetical protein